MKRLFYIFLSLALACSLVACSGGSDMSTASTVSEQQSVMAAVQTAAPHSSCPNGGIAVDAGIDTNGNGKLDPSEVTGTQYVCDGAQGAAGSNGLSAVVTVTSVPAGAVCINGGKLVSVGQDANSNGVLDTSEIASNAYLCFAVDGANGLNSITSAVAEAAGVNCTNGGLKMTSGLDANVNKVLDVSEVTTIRYVCNGANGLSGSNGSNGLSSLTTTVAEAAGVNCANGGLKMAAGLDANANQVLDAAEVSTTSYLCGGANGSNGANGNNGFNSLNTVVAEAAGANCTNGGLKLNAGLDANANNALDAAEVITTSYVCNGANGTSGTNGSNGLSSLTATSTEAAGANCSNGGLKMTAGLDANINNVLDAGEVTTTTYVCNGLNGSQGIQGVAGADGVNGLACWDVNGNGIADPGEDTNGDGSYTADDCNARVIPAGVSVYRWNVWSTYEQSTGWLASNSAALFGGVTPSTWSDANGVASGISPSGEVLRTVFNLLGRAGKNATVYADSWYSYSSTNGKIGGAVFRVRNTTGAAVNWTPYFHYTAYGVWGELASVSVNGANTWSSGTSGNTNVTLSLPANKISTVIFIVGSGSPSGSMRSTFLAFYNDSLALPAGLAFLDDLDTVVTAW